MGCAGKRCSSISHNFDIVFTSSVTTHHTVERYITQKVDKDSLNKPRISGPITNEYSDTRTQGFRILSAKPIIGYSHVSSFFPFSELISPRSIVMLSCHLYRLPSGYFARDFLTKILCAFLIFTS
jgi:hypothetical protein